MAVVERVEQRRGRTLSIGTSVGPQASVSRRFVVRVDSLTEPLGNITAISEWDDTAKKNVPLVYGSPHPTIKGLGVGDISASVLDQDGLVWAVEYTYTYQGARTYLAEKNPMWAGMPYPLWTMQTQQINVPWDSHVDRASGAWVPNLNSAGVLMEGMERQITLHQWNVDIPVQHAPGGVWSPQRAGDIAYLFDNKVNTSSWCNGHAGTWKSEFVGCREEVRNVQTFTAYGDHANKWNGQAGTLEASKFLIVTLRFTWNPLGWHRRIMDRGMTEWVDANGNPAATVAARRHLVAIADDDGTPVGSPVGMNGCGIASAPNASPFIHSWHMTDTTDFLVGLQDAASFVNPVTSAVDSVYSSATWAPPIRPPTTPAPTIAVATCA